MFPFLLPLQVCSGSARFWKNESRRYCLRSRNPSFLLNAVVSLCLLQDFAVSGIRFGTLYTENQDVANAVASLCYFHGVCGPVQHKVAQLLRDRGELVANAGSSCRPVISVLQGILSLYFPQRSLIRVVSSCPLS